MRVFDDAPLFGKQRLLVLGLLAVEEGLMKAIPKDYLFHAHHWLILHGRYVCKAQRPRCEACLISDLCTAPDRILPVAPPVTP